MTVAQRSCVLSFDVHHYLLEFPLHSSFARVLESLFFLEFRNTARADHLADQLLKAEAIACFCQGRPLSLLSVPPFLVKQMCFR